MFDSFDIGIGEVFDFDIGVNFDGFGGKLLCDIGLEVGKSFFVKFEGVKDSIRFVM